MLSILMLKEIRKKIKILFFFHPYKREAKIGMSAIGSNAIKALKKILKKNFMHKNFKNCYQVISFYKFINIKNPLVIKELIINF